METTSQATWLLVGVIAMTMAQEVAAAQSSGTDTALVSRIFEAEDSRATSSRSLSLLREGLEHSDPFIGAISVRALGRFEDSTLAPLIATGLESWSPQVRIAAGYALAQAVHTSTGDSLARTLLNALAGEPDAFVRTTYLHALARLRNISSQSRADIERSWVSAVTSPEVPDSALLTLARAAESLGRLARGSFEWTPDASRRLRAMSRFGRLLDEPSLNNARIRRLAIAALAYGNGIPEEEATDFLDDPDPGVRSLAVSLSSRLGNFDLRHLLRRAMEDESATVKTAALAAYATHEIENAPCEMFRTLSGDPVIPLSRHAIRALTKQCPGENAIEFLTELAGGSELGNTAWQRRAEALIGLSSIANSEARELARVLAGEDRWQLRMYAAISASITGDSQLAWDLTSDPHHNVQNAALDALNSLEGHEADRAFAQALAADDYQLLRAAALFLAGSPSGGELLPQLLSAFARVTGQTKETSRDVRIALIDRIAEFADEEAASALEQYLADFDAEVARRIADVLTGITGRSYSPQPSAAPPLAFPSFGDLAELNGTRAEIYIDGEAIAILLFPFEAPTNAFRFASLSRSGYFDGLTFHRVVPNFVIQGGSPGANEYSGDGPYTRDEVTQRAHWAGTVGLSTRGRDTGDAQFFINLVDNVRLDFDYTIFGEVVEGMDVVHRVAEGAVIDSVRLANHREP
ncbi:MAG: peptidylprolyl isomerase [Gemmatimonadota bacterium]|nr:peptidylprolyl isomerase [Gemmatimonadota bacterium]